MTGLEARGVGFRSLTESMDTTTSGGRLIFHVFGALAEFERGVARDRTIAGLAAARARGRMGGRPRARTDAPVEMARSLLADHTRPITEVCGALHVSRATLYRYVPTYTARPGGVRRPPADNVAGRRAASRNPSHQRRPSHARVPDRRVFESGVTSARSAGCPSGPTPHAARAPA